MPIQSVNDQPPPARVWKHPALALTVIAGLIGFLYPLYDTIKDLQSWEGGWKQPQMAATLILSTISALVAIAAASGLSLAEVFPNILALLGRNPVGTPQTGTSSKE